VTTENTPDDVDPTDEDVRDDELVLDDGDVFEDEDDLGDEGDDEDEEDEDDDDEEDDDEEDGDVPRGPAMAIVWTTAALVWAGVAFLKIGSPETPAGPAAAVVSEQADDEALPPPPPQDGTPADAGHSAEVDAEPEPEPAPVVSKIKLFDGPGAKHWDPAYADAIDPPDKVGYTVKRGGSIKFIANLYKIYHHEIEAWNPSFALDQELPPKTTVTVFKAAPGHQSESIGLATRGRLEGAVPMLDGPGRILKHTPWKGWATAETVIVLDRALRAWSERGPTVQPVLVGNMSSRSGGRLKPHGSHQSGRDVDLGYIQKGPDTKDLNWREMSSKNLDAGETWKLIETLVATGAVESIYIDSKLQKLLHDHAVEHKLVSKRDLGRWMEYPRPPGSGSPVIQHVKGHVDHLHVRFACPKTHSRCESKRG
jgi:murein endopeptidase